MKRKEFLEYAVILGSAGIIGCRPTSSPTAMTEVPKPQEARKVDLSGPQEKTRRIAAGTRLRNEAHYKVTHSGEVKELLTQPFVRLPIKKAAKDPEAYQGWFSNQDEVEKLGTRGHAAVDYELPYGTPLYAPISGLLVVTLEAGWRKRPRKDNPQLEEDAIIDGKRASYGGGIVWEIVKETDLRVQILHGASVDLSLKEMADKLGVKVFSSPTKGQDGSFLATGIRMPYQALVRTKVGLPVEAGQIIGTTGHSGLGLDHLGVIYNGEDWPVSIPENAYQSWDKPHAHVATHYRDGSGNKYGIRDIQSLYSIAQDYNDENGNLVFGPDSLVMRDANGQPLYAA